MLIAALVRHVSCPPPRLHAHGGGAGEGKVSWRDARYLRSTRSMQLVNVFRERALDLPTIRRW